LTKTFVHTYTLKKTPTLKGTFEYADEAWLFVLPQARIKVKLDIPAASFG